MKTLTFLVTIVLSVFLVNAQDKEITMSEFWGYMKMSRAETKDMSFRERVTVETSEYPDRNWQPYSSWIRDSVFPDQSRIIYTSQSERTIIKIGDKVYSKTPDSSWVKELAEKPFHVDNPAGLFGVGKAKLKVSYPRSEPHKGFMLIRYVKETGDQTDKKKIYDYWYEEKGVFVRKEYITHNGKNWLRRIEIIEYDPNIKIEAPIK